MRHPVRTLAFGMLVGGVAFIIGFPAEARSQRNNRSGGLAVGSKDHASTNQSKYDNIILRARKRAQEGKIEKVISTLNNSLKHQSDVGVKPLSHSEVLLIMATGYENAAKEMKLAAHDELGMGDLVTGLELINKRIVYELNHDASMLLIEDLEETSNRKSSKKKR